MSEQPLGKHEFRLVDGHRDVPAEGLNEAGYVRVRGRGMYCVHCGQRQSEAAAVCPGRKPSASDIAAQQTNEAAKLAMKHITAMNPKNELVEEETLP